MRLLETLENDETLGTKIESVIPPDNRDAILAAISKALPQEARLEFARFSGDKATQREIATALTRSITAICAAVGTQPIPLADFPILTSLEVLMIAGIIHVSGRDWNMATVWSFLAALGVNVGAGVDHCGKVPEPRGNSSPVGEMPSPERLQGEALTRSAAQPAAISSKVCHWKKHAAFLERSDQSLRACDRVQNKKATREAPKPVTALFFVLL